MLTASSTFGTLTSYIGVDNAQNIAHVGTDSSRIIKRQVSKCRTNVGFFW